MKPRCEISRLSGQLYHAGRTLYPVRHGISNLLYIFFLPPCRSERHDALYVVGSLDETLELRGMRYHPIDIETSVIRSHKSIAEW